VSYGVHIVRIEPATATRSITISLEEWLAYVALDKEFWLKGEFVALSPKGDTIRCDAPGLAEWTAPSSGRRALFDHGRSGRITVGNPSRATLVKMFQVAEALKAAVRGDEGEYYDASGNAR
jgi:hypothetical protein